MAALKILYLDNHLLVVAKPAGLATMGVTGDEPSLLGECKSYLKRKFAKPGNVYVGVVSRLDRPVSGVVVFARTSKAAARLNHQFRHRLVEKYYWAIVDPCPQDASGRWTDWLSRDESRGTMHVHGQPRDGAVQAELHFDVLEMHKSATLLQLHPITGRRHQLRAQLAAHGCPILGDRRYGSNRRFPLGIALHACSLTIEHPTLRTAMTFRAPRPASWRSYDFASLRPFPM